MSRYEFCFISFVLFAAKNVDAVTIDFDFAPNGNPIDAPTSFASTVPLDDLYAANGVRFGGQFGFPGGSILHQASNFGALGAVSGTNYLAITDFDGDSGLGSANAIQFIFFDTPANSVSMQVAANRNVAFHAFDNDGNQLVGVNQSATGWTDFSLVTQGNDIHSVQIAVVNGSGADVWMVMDDVVFTSDAAEPSVHAVSALPTPVPIPASLLFLISGLAYLRNLRNTI